MRVLARSLDEAFEIPGVRIRLGWDGLIGLIPGVGDLVTTLLSVYVMYLALAAGAPNSLLARMAINVATDSLLGSVPLLGDLFDIAWKSNRRNVQLMQSYLEHPEQVQRRSRAFVAAVVFALLAMAVGILWLVGALIRIIAGYL